MGHLKKLELFGFTNKMDSNTFRKYSKFFNLKELKLIEKEHRDHVCALCPYQGVVFLQVHHHKLRYYSRGLFAFILWIFAFILQIFALILRIFVIILQIFALILHSYSGYLQSNTFPTIF